MSEPIWLSLSEVEHYDTAGMTSEPFIEARWSSGAITLQEAGPIYERFDSLSEFAVALLTTASQNGAV